MCPASESTARLTDVFADWAGLPQPLHIFAALTGTRHYHFGTFEHRREPLTRCLQRTVEVCRALLPSSGRILDVGSGLGGTSELFARGGYDCLGLEPDAEAIRFARDASRNTPRLSFQQGSYPEDGDLTTLFDALVFIETLPHLPSPEDLFAEARRRLRPGGIVVISDVFAETPVDWRRAPFHQSSQLGESASRHGFEVGHSSCVTAAVVPTLDVLLEKIERHQRELIQGFAPFQRDIEVEIEELIQQCGLLKSGFLDGILSYQVMSWHRPVDARS